MIDRKRLGYFDFSQIAFSEIFLKGIIKKESIPGKRGMDAWVGKNLIFALQFHILQLLLSKHHYVVYKALLNQTVFLDKIFLM